MKRKNTKIRDNRRIRGKKIRKPISRGSIRAKQKEDIKEAFNDYLMDDYDDTYYNINR